MKIKKKLTLVFLFSSIFEFYVFFGVKVNKQFFLTFNKFSAMVQIFKEVDN